MYEGRVRVAGIMEFRDAEAPFDLKHIQSMVKYVKETLSGRDFEDFQVEWVSSRPVISSGRSLIGATKASNVYMANCCSMLGDIPGPVSGRAQARLIEIEEILSEMLSFVPLQW